MVNNYYKYFFLLTFFLGFLFLTNIGSYPLDTPDGARYSEIPREMVADHDYVTPHLNGVKYFEKPPLFYWLEAGSLKLFGNTELGANLANALIGLFTCLLIYFGVARIFGNLQGLLSGLLLGTSFLFFVLARVVTLDMTLTFFITATLLFFLLANQSVLRKVRQNYLWLMYFCIGLATMTKGLIGIIFPGAIILLWIIICNQWNMIKNYCIPSGMLIFLVIVLPWHILVQLRNPEFFHFYFIEQHFLRYLTNYAGRSQAWWFLPATFVGGFFPWIFWVPQAVRFFLPSKWWQNRKQYKNNLFFVIWVLFIYLFYTFSNSQLLPYLLPMFPPLAIIVGNYFFAKWNLTKNNNKDFVIGLILLTVFCVLFTSAVFIGIIQNKIHLGSISINTLYIAFLLLLTGSFLSVLVYWFCAVSNAKCISIIIVSSAFILFSISPVLTVANNHSVKDLALILKKKLHPGDEVVSYHKYYQDLPFYLEQTVTVVNYTGELAFGVNNQKNASDWMIDEKTFWRRWNHEKTMFMVIDKEKYLSLKESSGYNLYLLAEGANDVLLTNKAIWQKNKSS